MNIAAFNLGIALGAWGGGHIVAGIGLQHTPWIGALVVLGALGLTVLSGRLDARDPASVRGAAGRAAYVGGH